MGFRDLATGGAVAVAWACNGSEQKGLQVTDARVNALFNSPAGISCIQLIASAPLRTATRTFSVTPGQNTASLLLNGVPTGTVMFSGQAFNVACGLVDITTQPSSVAADLTLQVNPGPPISVQLNFHARTDANVRVNFADHAYTVTTIPGTAPL